MTRPAKPLEIGLRAREHALSASDILHGRQKQREVKMRWSLVVALGLFFSQTGCASSPKAELPAFPPQPGERLSQGGKLAFVFGDLWSEVVDSHKEAAQSEAVSSWIEANRAAVVRPSPSSSLPPWGIPTWERPVVVAYRDGKEVDVDLPFDTASELIDWMERVRDGRLDEWYANKRFDETRADPRSIAILAGRLRRLGNMDRAATVLLGHVDRVIRQPEMLDRLQDTLREYAVLSRQHASMRTAMRDRAEAIPGSWKAEAQRQTADPQKPWRVLDDDTERRMQLFVWLSIAGNNTDLIESRLSQSSTGSAEDEWLAFHTTQLCGGFATTVPECASEILAVGGRVARNPVERAASELASAAKVGRMGFGESKGDDPFAIARAASAVDAGRMWCQLCAAGRTREADQILRVVDSIAQDEIIRPAFLFSTMELGMLPSTTDKWLSDGKVKAQMRTMLQQRANEVREASGR